LKLVSDVHKLIQYSYSFDAKENNITNYTTLFRSIFDFHQKLNKECKISNLSSVYVFGLLQHNHAIEQSFIRSCYDRVKNILDIIEKAYVGFTDINEYDEIMLQTERLRNYTTQMKQENTICNSMFSQISKHFKQQPANNALASVHTGKVKNSNCSTIAIRFVTEVNHFLNAAEHQVTDDVSFTTSSLFTSMAHTYKKFNAECIDMSLKFMPPSIQPFELFIYGLGLHSENQQNHNLEGTFIDSCQNRLRSLFEEFAGAIKVTVKIDIVGLVHSVQTKIHKQRSENSICNQLDTQLFNHFR